MCRTITAYVRLEKGLATESRRRMNFANDTLDIKDYAAKVRLNLHVRRLRASPVNDDKKARFIRWLFNPPPEPTSPGEAIVWWERRRIPYNLIVGSVAIVSFVIYCVVIISTGVLQPGEDIVEPMALIAAPIAAPIVINICYTAGWLLDAPLRSFIPLLSPRFTSRLFTAGFVFSIFVVSLPALYWVGYRLLQLLHVIH